mmetsp:Transcript_29352/g.54463  ORF Transcript_29352/g.54463 Transcript_29352/m.54463 type:complete len:85 (+) Transcript_29352:1425-1679(+)
MEHHLEFQMDCYSVTRMGLLTVALKAPQREIHLVVKKAHHLAETLAIHWAQMLADHLDFGLAVQNDEDWVDQTEYHLALQMDSY